MSKIYLGSRLADLAIVRKSLTATLLAGNSLSVEKRSSARETVGFFGNGALWIGAWIMAPAGSILS